MSIEIEYCPECKAKNYVDLGDMMDQTAPDVSHFKCYKCKKEFMFAEIKEYLEHCEEWEKEFFGDGICVNGQEKLE